MFDTDVVNVLGGGTIDLKDERLDLTLNPQPKVASIASLRSPLYVAGTLAKPGAGPDTTRLAAKGIGALVLGIIAAPLAIAPLVETGPGQSSDCGRLIQEAKALPAKRPSPPPSQAKSEKRPPEQARQRGEASPAG